MVSVECIDDGRLTVGRGATCGDQRASEISLRRPTNFDVNAIFVIDRYEFRL